MIESDYFYDFENFLYFDYKLQHKIYCDLHPRTQIRKDQFHNQFICKQCAKAGYAFSKSKLRQKIDEFNHNKELWSL